ncbi:MAG: hypothetical protein MRY32_08860 [Rickettsiales bacterium]|nr:hypothetical protein [Rickettsiales bacterium]
MASRNTQHALHNGFEFGSIVGALFCALHYVHTGMTFAGALGPINIANPIIGITVGLGGGAFMGAMLGATLFAAGSILVHNIPGMAKALDVPDLNKLPNHRKHQTHLQDPSKIKIENAIGREKLHHAPDHVHHKAETQKHAKHVAKIQAERAKANNQTRSREI